MLQVPGIPQRAPSRAENPRSRKRMVVPDLDRVSKHCTCMRISSRVADSIIIEVHVFSRSRSSQHQLCFNSKDLFKNAAAGNPRSTRFYTAPMIRLDGYPVKEKERQRPRIQDPWYVRFSRFCVKKSHHCSAMTVLRILNGEEVLHSLFCFALKKFVSWRCEENR